MQLHEFLTSALDGDKWSASRYSHISSGEDAAGTHCTGGRVGVRVCVDARVQK
jgi:hypothetical protein